MTTDVHEPMDSSDWSSGVDPTKASVADSSRFWFLGGVGVKKGQES
jgi:hypothetical protein